MKKEKDTLYIKGRGAQEDIPNRFLRLERTNDEADWSEDTLEVHPKTIVFEEHPKTILNKVPSPDIGMNWSMNPYQGCEHGCVYCYARPTHEYWGFSPGLDFERKIVVKRNAAELLRKHLSKKSWKPVPIMLSGNTDCYQPLERKFKITREILKVLVEFQQPVGIITKNDLILRDMDLIKELAKMELIHVSLSITSLNEELRRLLEPRTVAASKRLHVVRTLSEINVPVNVMVAPLIPGLNSHEVYDIIKASAEHGASSALYIISRFNGPVERIFSSWLKKNFPDRADKVMNQVAACHGGNVSDSRFKTRMRGEGNIAESIRAMYHVAMNKYMKGRSMKPLNCNAFSPPGGKQLGMFDAQQE